MNIIEKPINEVIPYEKNPRINDNAVPAVQMGRVARVLELDPKYCDVIVERYINLVGSFDEVAVERNGKMIKYADL